MSLIGYLIVVAASGLLVGALARLALPGADPMTLPETMLVGIVASFVAGVVARVAFDSATFAGTRLSGYDQDKRERRGTSGAAAPVSRGRLPRCPGGYRWNALNEQTTGGSTLAALARVGPAANHCSPVPWIPARAARPAEPTSA